MRWQGRVEKFLETIGGNIEEGKKGGPGRYEGERSEYGWNDSVSRTTYYSKDDDESRGKKDGRSDEPLLLALRSPKNTRTPSPDT